MKRIINIALITIAIATIGTINAKQTKNRRPTSPVTIPVTKNTKSMLVNVQTLKNAKTPQARAQSIEKVEENIAKDPYARLTVQEIALRKKIAAEKEEIALLTDIAEQEEMINTQASYISYFDTEEVKEAKTTLAGLETELEVVQAKLGKIKENQPVVVSRLKYYAVATLIGTIGLAAVLQRFGYVDATGNISSAAKTAWSYAPSASGTWAATKSLFGYGSAAVSVGLALLNAKSFAQRLSAEIAGEEGKDNPDQEKINQLYEQLEEQNQRIAELEAKTAKKTK